MKTLKQKLFALPLILLIGAATLAGCSKNNSSSGASSPQYNWNNCSGCSGVIGNPYPGLLGVKSSTGAGDALFAFDIIINQQNGSNWQNPKAFLYYNGPATLQGVIRIIQAGNSFCGAPAGDYQVYPQSPSMVSTGGIVSNGTFVAQGPTQIVFRVGQSPVYNSQDPNGVYNGSQYNRINFSLIVDSVNGMYCGPLSTY